MVHDALDQLYSEEKIEQISCSGKTCSSNEAEILIDDMIGRYHPKVIGPD